MASKQLRRDDVAGGEKAGLELERSRVESLICHSVFGSSVISSAK